MFSRKEIPVELNAIKEKQGTLEEFFLPFLPQVWSSINPLYLTVRQDILVGWNDRECLLLLIIALLVLHKLLSCLRTSMKRFYRGYIKTRRFRIPQKDLATIEKLRSQEAKRI